MTVTEGADWSTSSIDAVEEPQQSKGITERVCAMAKAKCPVCAQDVAAPFFLKADAWRWLVCPHCAARLERKKPRYAVAFMPFLIVLTPMGGGWGHRFTTFAEVLMVAIVVVIFVEFAHPQLQVRKPLPKPEITLNINGSSR